MFKDWESLTLTDCSLIEILKSVSFREKESDRERSRVKRKKSNLRIHLNNHLLYKTYTYHMVQQFLHIYPRERKPIFTQKTCSGMFMGALFVISKRWKPQNCLSVSKRVNKLWFIQTVEYNNLGAGEGGMNELLVSTVRHLSWVILCGEGGRPGKEPSRLAKTKPHTLPQTWAAVQSVYKVGLVVFYTLVGIAVNKKY